MPAREPIAPLEGDHVVDLRPEFAFRTGTVTGIIRPEGVLFVQPDATYGSAAAEFNVPCSAAALLDYDVPSKLTGPHGAD